jgi:hypothetical protein
LQCNRAQFKKGGNSNLIDYNAIVHNLKRGGNSNLINCNVIAQNKKGGNSNLIDCNAISQNIKGGSLQFNRLQCKRAKYKREVTPIQ